jgi:hypothetical protein
VGAWGHWRVALVALRSSARVQNGLVTSAGSGVGSVPDPDRLPTELLDRIRSVVAEGDTIWTVANGKRNVILEISAEGIRVETDRSSNNGTGPQLVPAALINLDWERLQSTGQLRLRETSHRGSFSCALFSLFPEVVVGSTRPVELRLRGAK